MRFDFSPRWVHCMSVLAIALGAFLPAMVRADAPDAAALEKSYAPDIRPLMQRYCNECHSGENIEADIDLAAFPSIAEVRKHTKVWQKIDEMLASGQMPPKKAKQPSDAERAAMRKWVRVFLTVEARAHAGDPGRVVLRRLSNAEYTYTLRDLTGIDSLDPAREFPVDGAAGEGFTNTGSALVMSPALVTKYLDAAKAVAGHAVLLPDGIRFSPSASPSDWTNETLAEIRGFYSQFTDPRGGDKVNLQGIVFQTNEGGRLPLEKYLAATIDWREAKAAGRDTLDALVRERGLSAKYLRTLLGALTEKNPSPLLDPIRAQWAAAKPADVPALAANIAQWQKALFKFSSVGHIGKVGGPKRWLEPVSPLATQQPVRLKIPTPGDSSEVIISLIASDAGDGNENDFVIWQQPRLVAAGRPDVLLRDVRAVSRELAQRRQHLFAGTTKYLEAAAEASSAQAKIDANNLATKHGVEGETLKAWLDYLGISAGGRAAAVKIEGHFKTKIDKASNYDFIKGWGSNDTPLLLANSSDQHVRVPGNMKPHGVAVHPSPKVRAIVGWQSPVAAMMRIDGNVTHAHPECGNGVTWSLELRRGGKRQRLAAGVAQGNKHATVGPIERISVQQGDVVSLLIGPRDGNHSCDLTAIDLTLTPTRRSRGPGTSRRTCRPMCSRATLTQTVSATRMSGTFTRSRTRTLAMRGRSSPPVRCSLAGRPRSPPMTNASSPPRYRNC